MSYVAAEILGLLAAAAVLGVLLGWALFGGRRRLDPATRNLADEKAKLVDEKAKLEAELKVQAEARKSADARASEAGAQVAAVQNRSQQSEARVVEAERQLAEVTKKLDEQAKVPTGSSVEIEGRDQRIAALEAQLRLHDAEVARLAGGGQLAARTEAELKTQIGDRERTIERLRGELESLRARSSPDAPKLAELQAEIVELRATLVATAGVAPATDLEKDQTIARLTEEVTGLRAAYEAAEQALEEQDAAIDKLTRDIVQSQQKLAQAEIRPVASKPVTPASPILPVGALMTPVTPMSAPPAPRPGALPPSRPATLTAMPAVDYAAVPTPAAPSNDAAVTGSGGFVRRPTTPAMPAVAGVRAEADLAPTPYDGSPAVRRPQTNVLTTNQGGPPAYAARPEVTGQRPAMTGPPSHAVRRPSTPNMVAFTSPRPSVEASPYTPAPPSSPGLDRPSYPAFRAARALGPPDDLKRIRGVGPATEKRLNEVGVTTWAQVAALTAPEIPTIADIAKVSIDKIRPWIDQAKMLVASPPTD